ncbi:MAG: hypothetical protein ACHQZS_10780 [Candidatus Binatales bacterium]
MSPVAIAHAQDSTGDAAQLSDRAFALLNSLTASSAGPSNPALGAVASFAGDAQALSSALKAGGGPDAGRAMASLIQDRSAVDTVLAAHPGAIDSSQWSALKQQVDQLAAQVKPLSTAASASSDTGAVSPPAASAPSGAAGPPPAAAESSPAGAGSSVAESSDVPKVHIDSYAVTGHSVRIRGFFEGLALKSAGIYNDDQLVRDLKVDQLPGRQQVNFDIEVEEVEPGMVLRVYDGAGLSAEASIASRLGIQGTGGAKEVELGPPSDVPVSIGDEPPSVEVNAPDGNVAEIPSSESPSQRHVAHRAPNSQLGDLQVNIISATLDDAETHAYDVIGQINGSRVSHAGIYVDGKLVRPIDLDTEDGFTVEPFDETFQMNGRHATVRVYNVRDEYIERPINLAAAVPEMPGGDMSEMPPIVMNPNPNQLAVQITGVRQIAANAMVIGGVLSGKNLSAAGVYQNGIEVQMLPVSAGLLSALGSSSYRQVNFTATVNPIAGAVTVRVFDTSGQFVEQPLMVGGINPYAINRYGSGVNPYGNPYGAPGYPPGSYPPPPSSSTPWWQKLLH